MWPIRPYILVRATFHARIQVYKLSWGDGPPEGWNKYKYNCWYQLHLTTIICDFQISDDAHWCPWFHPCSWGRTCCCQAVTPPELRGCSVPQASFKRRLPPSSGVSCASLSRWTPDKSTQWFCDQPRGGLATASSSFFSRLISSSRLPR